MPPKGGSTKLAPPRLPPLPKLRVRRPNAPQPNPCVGIMTSVLGMILLLDITAQHGWLLTGVKGVGRHLVMQRRGVRRWSSR